MAIQRKLCTTISDEFDCPWCYEPIEVGSTFYQDMNTHIIGCSERCVKKLVERLLSKRIVAYFGTDIG